VIETKTCGIKKLISSHISKSQIQLTSNSKILDHEVNSILA